MKRKEVFVGLSLAVVLAIFSFLAASSPDGLERVAQDQEFHDKATAVGVAIFTDYRLPGIKNEKLATLLAAVGGVAGVFVLGTGLGKLLKKSTNK